MADLWPALVTAGAGLVLLAVLALVVRRPVRRFTRANGELRAAVGRRLARLQALRHARR